MFSTDSNDSHTSTSTHKLSVFIPEYPNRITKKLYVCGKQFNVDCIASLFTPKDKLFGLALIHGETAKICTFNECGSSTLQIVKSINEELATRHNKGGQSQNRHQRNYDIIVNVYLNIVCDAIKNAYLDDTGVPIVEGIIIAGTSNKRKSVAKKLPKLLQSIVLSDITVKSKNITPEDIVDEHCKKIIYQHTIHTQTMMWNNWLKQLELNSDCVVYGKKEVATALKYGLLKSIIIHTNLYTAKKISIDKIANENRCGINVISSISESGNELLTKFGGVVGIKWNC